MINHDSSSSWEDETWDSFRKPFQFTSGNSMNISFYSEYLSEFKETDVDLDSLVRENQKSLSQNLLLNKKSKRLKLHIRKHRSAASPQNRKFSPSSEKRPNKIGNTRTLNQTRNILSSGTTGRAALKTPQISSGEIRQNQKDGEDSPSHVTKFILRPISQRPLLHVTPRDEVDNIPWRHPHFTQNQESPLRFSRTYSGEELNQEFQSQRRSTDTDEENDEILKSPVVSDLVSKFENVRRKNTSSNHRNQSITKATSEPSASNGPRHSIRILSGRDIKRNSLDRSSVTEIEESITNNYSRSNQDLLPTLSPSSTDHSRLVRMKSEGNIPRTPTSTAHHPSADQYSRLHRSEPKRLLKGYSMDSPGRSSLHPSLIGDSPQYGSSPAVHKLRLNIKDAANVQRVNSLPKIRPDHRQPSVNTEPKINISPDRKVSLSNNNVPSWKSEVDHRIIANSSLPSPKVDQTIRFVTIPEWKIQLLKKKKEKRSSTEIQNDPLSSRKTVTIVNYTEPPWKVEFEKIRRHQTTQHHNHFHFEPEWVKLAEQRKQSRITSAEEDGC